MKGQGCSELEEEGGTGQAPSSFWGCQAGSRLVRLEVESTDFRALEAGPPVSLDVAFVGVEYRRPPHPLHTLWLLWIQWPQFVAEGPYLHLGFAQGWPLGASKRGS